MLFYVHSPSVLSVCSDFVLPAFSLGLFLCVVWLFIILGAQPFVIVDMAS